MDCCQKMNPFKVAPKPCWAFSIPLYIVLTTGVIIASTFFVMANITLITQPTVTEKIRAAAPPLPYIYLCPNKQPYTLAGPVYVGCADNISDTTLPVQPSVNGGTARSGPLCALHQLVTVKIMDRDVGGPVDTQCIVFQHVLKNKDIPWKTQVYMMLQRGQFTGGLSTATLDVLPMGLNAYLSVYGPNGGEFDLALNQGFLRSITELNRVNGLEKFEEGAIFLPVDIMSFFRVQKIRRIFQVKSAQSLRTFVRGSTPITKFTVLGGGVNAPLPNLVPGLIRLHGLSGDADDFEAAAATISISYDEIKYTEINQLGIILLIIGIVPVYLGMATKFWAYFFAPFPKPGPSPRDRFLGYLRKAPEEEKKDGEEILLAGKPDQQIMSKV